MAETNGALLSTAGRLLTAAVLLIVACGDADGPSATGAPMGSAVAVSGDNQPPVIRSVRLEPASPKPGDLLDARVELHDSEGDAVHLFYRWRVNGRPVDGAASFHVDAMPEGTLIEVEVIARDASGESQPATAAVRVGNRPPMMLGVVIEPLGAVTRDQAIIAEPRARDPEQDELSFEYTWWVNGAPVEGQGAKLPRDRFRRGDRIELEVVASDGSNESEPLRSQPFEVENASPRIVSQPSGFDTDGIFQYELIAEDADGDSALSFRLVEGPAGMQLDRTSRLLTWRPASQQAGEHAVVIEVEDRLAGKSRQEFSLNLGFGQVPAAPAP